MRFPSEFPNGPSTLRLPVDGGECASDHGVLQAQQPRARSCPGQGAFLRPPPQNQHEQNINKTVAEHSRPHMSLVQLGGKQKECVVQRIGLF